MTKTQKQDNSITNYSKIKEVTFNNVKMLGVQADSGKIYTSVKRICEDLGILFHGQSERIKKDEVLKTGIQFFCIPTNQGNQDTFCIDIKYLPIWLTKIKASKCKEEIRPHLLEFQFKAKDILADAFINTDKKEEKKQPEFQIPKTLSEALLLAGKAYKELEEKDQRLSIAEPKALLLDAFTDTTELKTLKQLGYGLKRFGIGPYKIFEFLRDEKVLTKVNGENYPTHEYAKYFTSKWVTKSWQDKKTGDIKNITFDVLKAKPEFYMVLAQLLVKNKILSIQEFTEIDFNNVPEDSFIDNNLFT